MQHGKALLSTTIHPRDSHTVPNARKSAKKSQQTTAGDSKSRSGKRISFIKLLGTNKPGKLQPTTEMTEQSVDQSGQIESLFRIETPWRNYQAPVLHVPIRRPGVMKTSDELKPHRNSLWNRTPRVRRIELLDPEEQELAIQLASVNLTPRDQRSVQNKMRQFTPQAQSQIMECSHICVR